MGNENNYNESREENNILMIGKMRVGKSSIIKLITDKDAKIGEGVDPVTSRPCLYKGILNKINFKCIDTPGLSESTMNDIFHLSDLKKFLVENELSIKHIILLINFHDQAFSEEFQKELTTIITYFPMPNLWNHITLCYTHFYPEGCKTVNELLKEKYPSLKNNFEKIINKYSDLGIKKIDYNDIKKLYVDIYFPDDSQEKKNKNLESLKILQSHLKEIFNEKPMYSSIKSKVEKLEYAKIAERDQENAVIYSNDIEITQYFDINYNEIGKSYRIVGKEKISQIKSKSFWKRLMGSGIVGAITGGLVGLGCIGLAFVPGGVAISGVVLASIGITGGGVGLAGTGLAIGSSIRDDQLIEEIKKKEKLKEEIDKTSKYE